MKTQLKHSSAVLLCILLLVHTADSWSRLNRCSKTTQPCVWNKSLRFRGASKEFRRLKAVVPPLLSPAPNTADHQSFLLGSSAPPPQGSSSPSPV